MGSSTTAMGKSWHEVCPTIRMLMLSGVLPTLIFHLNLFAPTQIELINEMNKRYRPAIPKVRYSERLLPTVTLGFREFGYRNSQCRNPLFRKASSDCDIRV